MKPNQQNMIGFIWTIANKLRGPYRPPQYRRVMLPMTVLRRMDCVLEPTKDRVLKELARCEAQGLPEKARHTVLGKAAAADRKQPFYNTSPFTFQKLLGDPDNIARNLVSYIKGFSPNAREIFEKFEFEQEIEKLANANRLYLIVKEFADLNLHPQEIDNLQMGYIFEELVRKFNEQANEEAGDHFTPREVIRLMAHLIYTKDEDVYRRGISRTIYDPTCGTGGMLSVSEEYIRNTNKDSHLTLFGQEYNDESYAVCVSDLLIKDEPVDNIIHGDTLGDGKSRDGHPGKRFHYMLANPPFGVEWKAQQQVVEKEHKELGFEGRFGPGLPRINDGALLFLLHMISKMNPSPENGGEGSKIAVVFNGSPMFTGDAGSGESNIRRWIIESDWLDAVIALPDQLFYNTGIYTYIWLVTNRKAPGRKGKVQLIDATHHYEKMRKSLGNKRNLLSEDQLGDITKLYADFQHDGVSALKLNGDSGKRICSKIFDNRDFGFLKITVERPLRLNFQVSPERIERLKSDGNFLKLAESKKTKDKAQVEADIKEGQLIQADILKLLQAMDSTKLYKNREKFLEALDAVSSRLKIRLAAPQRKLIISALGERDPDADICTDARNNPEPDSELRDTELVPLPGDITLPLPLDYGDKPDNEKLVKLVRKHCEDYLRREVHPHVPDAWIDFAKTTVGYEIPLNRHFYVYQPPRPLDEIEKDIKTLEGEIMTMLKGIVS